MPHAADQSKYRKEVFASDLADRLLLNFDVNELLLWPPNLFAFTSYILSLTGAYQLVISPPRLKRWPPRAEEIPQWFEGLAEKASGWLGDVEQAWLGRGGEWDDEAREKAADFLGRVRAYRVEEVLGRLAREKAEARGRPAPAAPQGKAQKARRAREEEPAAREDLPPVTWNDFVRAVGREWRRSLSGTRAGVLRLIKAEGIAEGAEKARANELLAELAGRTPIPVVACWNILRPLLRESISKLLCNDDACAQSEVEKYWPTAQAILTLHAIADETCVGWGIHKVNRDEKPDEWVEFGGNALEYAQQMLLAEGTMSTIGNERCRVLPKRHNPNIGITLRSLSSNLAFHRSSIDVIWRQSDEDNPLSERLNRMKLVECERQTPSASETITALLLPWPMEVSTSDFKDYQAVKGGELPIDLDERKYGLFLYSPPAKDNVGRIIEMVEAAKRESARGEPVDMVIMPESSIRGKSLEDLEERLVDPQARPGKAQPDVSVIIAGVRDDPYRERRFARNAVHCRTIREGGRHGYTYGDAADGPGDRTVQHKHHRWKLDESQIRQYGLSTALDPGRQWWEAIKVGRRRVSFINLGNKITICPLICEDLARQDPISDLIRHVGPTMVVTILMDGPQKADRWSSRYAGVLSEDPGSAVLTLSSYGMVRRWSSPYRQMSSVVALWNDGRGPAREIELAQGAEGVLLRLKVTSRCEPTADGRVEKHPTARIELLDVVQVRPRRA